MEIFGPILAISVLLLERDGGEQRKRKNFLLLQSVCHLMI
jgi:hypothetical protein